MIPSINRVESIIEISRFFILFLSFVSIYYLSNKQKVISNFIQNLVLVLLVLELCVFYFQLYSFLLIEDNFYRNAYVSGISVNSNISSFLLLYKVPFVLVLLSQSNLLKKKFFYLIILFLSVSAIFLLGSRGSILGFFILTIIFTTYIFFKNNFKTFSGFIFKLFSIIGLSFILSNYLTNNNSTAVSNRITNYSDSSVEARLRYYDQALQTIAQNPLLGTGIGTWKINAIDLDKINIKDYQSPYHVHNDFLQIFAETGFFGFLFYVLIFLSPILIFYNKKKPELYIPIFLSLLAFAIDSFLNFPKHRPVQISFILLLLSYLYLEYLKNSSIQTVRLVKFNVHFLIAIAIFLIYPSVRILNSYVDQKPLIQTFNSDGNLSEDFLNNLEINFPNISVTSIPLSGAKAHFKFKNGKNREAKDLLIKTNKSSPFFYFEENLLANIYLKEKKIDSALHYAKTAFYNLPNNAAHSTTYTRALEINGDIEEIENVFELIDKSVRRDVDWKNYLAMIAIYKDSFSLKNKLYAKQALELFPSNKEFLKYARIIEYGKKVISSANELDQKARIEFDNGNFSKAIEYWEQAIVVFNMEPVYYQGIAKSYANLGEYEKAIEQLLMIDDKMLVIDDGSTNFYLGGYYYNIKKRKLACENLYKSRKLGYTEAENLIRLICN